MNYIFTEGNKHSELERYLREETHILDNSEYFINPADVRKSVYGEKYAIPFVPEYFSIYLESGIFTHGEIALASELTNEFLVSEPVYLKRYIFTVRTEDVAINEDLKIIADPIIARIKSGEPNPPVFFVHGEDSIVGFDEVLMQHAIFMQSIGITIFEKQTNGEYLPVKIETLPIE